MPTDDQVQLVPKRQYPLVGSGAGYSSWVHLDDGEAAVTMMTEGRGFSNATAKRET